MILDSCPIVLWQFGVVVLMVLSFYSYNFMVPMRWSKMQLPVTNFGILTGKDRLGREGQDLSSHQRHDETRGRVSAGLPSGLIEFFVFCAFRGGVGVTTF